MAKRIKTGGRRKGSPNKKTLIFAELLQEKGLDIVGEIKKAIQEREIDLLRALTDMLPYITPRLKESEVAADEEAKAEDDLSQEPTEKLLEIINGK